jgi:hypothetical protein
MRITIPLLVALALCACTDPGPTESNYLRVAPPTLSVNATSRARTVEGGSPDLEISALLRNATSSHIQVAVGAQCPLAVRLFSDPTGEFTVSVSASMGCAPNGPTIDLAPGDTAVLTHVIRADSLASLTQGNYGVNVVVTTNTSVIGVWAGAVRLPLGSAQ